MDTDDTGVWEAEADEEEEESCRPCAEPAYCVLPVALEEGVPVGLRMPLPLPLGCCCPCEDGLGVVDTAAAGCVVAEGGWGASGGRDALPARLPVAVTVVPS